MMNVETWRFDPGVVVERLALGLDLFGPYAAWLWIMPAMWVLTAIALWLYLGWQQRRSDRAFLAYASRNLPLLGRIAKYRAQEVVLSKTYDRF